MNAHLLFLMKDKQEESRLVEQDYNTCYITMVRGMDYLEFDT